MSASHDPVKAECLVVFVEQARLAVSVTNWGRRQTLEVGQFGPFQTCNPHFSTCKLQHGMTTYYVFFNFFVKI